MTTKAAHLKFLELAESIKDRNTDTLTIEDAMTAYDISLSIKHAPIHHVYYDFALFIEDNVGKVSPELRWVLFYGMNAVAELQLIKEG